MCFCWAVWNTPQNVLLNNKTRTREVSLCLAYGTPELRILSSTR